MAADERHALDRETIRRAVSEALAKTIFSNRYMFHPSRVDGLAEEIAQSLLTFRSDGLPETVQALGSSLSRAGLSIRSVMGVVGVLQHHCRGEVEVDRYAAELLEGFSDSKESEILSSQEQLRRALTSTLERQGRELLIKNQAIDSSLNAIMIADLDGKITYVNRSFLAMWDCDGAEEAVGRTVDEFWKDDEAQAVIERFVEAGGFSGEMAAHRSDGSAFSVSLSASYIRNVHGEAIGIMAFFVDVTESKSLELQMQQIQKMDDLGQLAGGIVHDFNNLLAAIGGYLQLVLLEAPNEGQMHIDLMQIKAAVDRGAGLTKQLGYFTRQATGKREIISLNDVANETYELIKHTFPPEIAVHLQLAPSLWKIEADPNQMSQVIMNLCVNGRDAITEKERSGNGSPRGSLSIETSNVELSERAANQYVDVAPGRYVALRITDTGVGIAPHVRRRLFVPFVTTKTTSGGTGLGLAVVYGIVRSHRGFIDVTSTRGAGTTFFVYLPMADRLLQTRRNADGGAPLVRGQGTILVVDDELQVRQVVARALRLSGYRVIEAANGRSAIACYREQAEEIDLVVLDIVMPELNGRETLERLREIDPEVTALFMTGYTSNGRPGRWPDHRAELVMEKPINLRLLTERVRRLIEQVP